MTMAHLRSFLMTATCFAVACSGVATGAAVMPGAAMAQSGGPDRYESRTVTGRVEKLERDLMLLQRQVARGEPVTVTAGEGVDSSAATDVRFTEMQEQMRRLQGKLEEVEFQNRQLKEQLEKAQKDNEFRFTQLEHKAAPALSNSKSDKAEPADKAEKAEKSADGEDNSAAAEHENTAKNSDNGSTKTEEKILKVPDGVDMDNPRDNYNYAFRLLRQAKHEEAGQAFEGFIKKFPKDPLVGNAYYWLGESYYARKDFVKAADSFRQGFEVDAKGAKSADNLLKLAMSLSALKQNDKACVVLGQLVKKYPDASDTLKQKAKQERERIACE